MNVEAYRKTIRRRIAIMAALGVSYVVAMIVTHTVWHPGSTYAGDFLLGAMAMLVTCFVLLMPRYVKALRDEQALRRLWNREHDERMQAIKARAGVPMLLYTSLAMIGIGLLLSAWNMTVCLTLLIAATAQLLVSIVTKFVCKRIM